MCGRYTGNDEESEELKSIYGRTKRMYPDAELKLGEIFPTNRVPVLHGRDLQPIPAVWGFPGFHSGVIINARAETVTEKYSFRDSVLNRRCAVPTTGYIEWDSHKGKHRFNLPDSRLLFLGGFWKQFPYGVRFVILTTSPNKSVADVHDRMPLVLPPEFAEKWVVDTESALIYLKAKMPDLIRDA